jgi:hypothetical protein
MKEIGLNTIDYSEDCLCYVNFYSKKMYNIIGILRERRERNSIEDNYPFIFGHFVNGLSRCKFTYL